MPLRRFSAAIFVLAFAAAPALADDTAAAIRKAEKLYRQGNLGKAFDELEEATTLVARQLSVQYAKTFPPAPSGWRAQSI